jgi:tripartite-type tricarboxylate transporter receptor subunit TctC
MKLAFVAAYGASLLLGWMPVAMAQGPDFYKGKHVDLYIGYTVGGGYDIYARLLARHLGRHIPGNPTVVPRNMPRAGSLTLANWLYQAAPKDGRAFGTIGRGGLRLTRCWEGRGPVQGDGVCVDRECE